MSMQTYSLVALSIGFFAIGFTLWYGLYSAKKSNNS